MKKVLIQALHTHLIYALGEREIKAQVTSQQIQPLDVQVLGPSHTLGNEIIRRVTSSLRRRLYFPDICQKILNYLWCTENWDTNSQRQLVTTVVV